VSILDVYCSVDDFWQRFAPRWEAALLVRGAQRRRRAGQMHPSEIMTIVIWFHQSHYRTFKAYYTEEVQQHLRAEFPTLLSYTRFVELMPRVLVPLAAYLHTQLGTCTGLSFIDSTKLAVCHNARIGQHRVFAGRARRGKTSVGWFFGFKLHLVVNDRGELLAFCLTPGNGDDRRPVPKLVKRLFGKLFGDRGYISQPLAQRLFVEQGLQLITKLRKNMHERLLAWSDKVFLRKRAIIESVVDQLKNISQIEHSRHRSPTNFLVNLVAGLIAYCHQPRKPSLGLGPLALPVA
jgi:DDE family transposase